MSSLRSPLLCCHGNTRVHIPAGQQGAVVLYQKTKLGPLWVCVCVCGGNISMESTPWRRARFNTASEMTDSLFTSLSLFLPLLSPCTFLMPPPQPPTAFFLYLSNCSLPLSIFPWHCICSPPVLPRLSYLKSKLLLLKTHSVSVTR